MSIFGVLFVQVGFLFLISPLLPAMRKKGRIEKRIAVLIGVYFVLHGVAVILGVENHPVLIGIVVILFVAVVTLFAYDRLSGESS